MQKANSPHTAGRKHLSPKLSGKCSAATCQLGNNMVFICSREHLFSWQASIQQRQLTGTLLVSRAVSSAGDMKETQKLFHAAWNCMTVVVTSYRALSPWLAGRSFPRKLMSLSLVHSRGGRLPHQSSVTPWGWSCWWPQLWELSCGWGTMWPGRGTVGRGEQSE